ncbi:hypothetical protein KDA11_06155, partial [Candidatus Saccharibacteria bacterium]|nr:hypothetical protein [Candidatus Saccharibacteria bacterium]
LWDYDLKYPGPVTLRYALGGSRNVPAVKAMLTAGVDKTINVAEKLGLKSGYKCYLDEQNTKEGPCYASSAIGDGAYLHLDEHVHAYASISRNGVNIPQTYILKITNASGKIINEWKPSEGSQAIRAETAYILNNMMSDPNASYFPAGRKPHRYNGWRFGMKTGTTNDGKDGWMMGMSPQYAAGVWVGNYNRSEMTGTMENMTQPIWQGWMNAAHDGKTAFDWQKPEGIQTLPAFVVRNNPGVGAVVPSASTDIFPSWYKANNRNSQGQTIDKVSGKLATNCTPERAKETVAGGSANQFSSDRWVGTSGGNTNENDDVHKCEDSRPSIALNITSSGNNYNLSVNVVQGTHPISSDKFKGTVNYIIDGQIIRSATIDNAGSNIAEFTYTPDFTGSKGISAQIIDSALYDGSSESGTISSVSQSTYTVVAENEGGNTYSFAWSSGASGTVTIYKGNTVICSGPATGSGCTSGGGGPYSVTPSLSGVYAKDSSGKQVTVSGS